MRGKPMPSSIAAKPSASLQHRDLEALKERQFAAAQQSRLRQAQERKGIAELHRMERQQLVQAHERSRGREIGVSQRAFERAGRESKASKHRTGPWLEPRAIPMMRGDQI